MPNVSEPGVSHNYEFTRPNQTILSWQPAVRVDYQPATKLRITGKYSGWQQRRDIIQGALPGFNDTQMQRPVISNLVFSGNYNLNNTTFIEATYGRSRNELAGCALAQSGTGPTACTNAIVMNEGSNKNNVGLGNLPMLFPDANKLNPDYYAYAALNKMNPAPPAWVNGEFLKPPTFAWGNRVGSAPPNLPFPSYFNVNATQDVSVSLTKVMGRHTIKAGFFNTHSYKAEQAHERPVVGRAELRAGHARDQPVRHLLRIRQRRHGGVQLVPAGVQLRRGQLRLRQPRGLHPGQLARERTADARLRHALRQRRAAVRQARTGFELPAREVGARRTRRCSISRAAPSRKHLARRVRRPASRRATRRRASSSARTRRWRSRRWSPARAA